MLNNLQCQIYTSSGKINKLLNEFDIFFNTLSAVSHQGTRYNSVWGRIYFPIEKFTIDHPLL